MLKTVTLRVLPSPDAQVFLAQNHAAPFSTVLFFCFEGGEMEVKLVAAQVQAAVRNSMIPLFREVVQSPNISSALAARMYELVSPHLGFPITVFPCTGQAQFNFN